LAAAFIVVLFSGGSLGLAAATLACLGLGAAAWLQWLAPLHGAVAGLSVLLWAGGLSGLRGLKVGAAGENIFASVVAPSRARHWSRKFARPQQGGTLKGLYLVARGLTDPVEKFALWMEQEDAFLDPGERDGIAVFLPLGPQGSLPVEAVWRLYNDAGRPAMAVVAGDVHFETGQWLGQFRWCLSGRAKEKAQALAENASKERLLITEAEYQGMREKVKIQLLGSRKLAGDPVESKIFNILEVIS
jgi:hypothetical protein